jgi:hypothetical protein
VHGQLESGLAPRVGPLGAVWILLLQCVVGHQMECGGSSVGPLGACGANTVEN